MHSTSNHLLDGWPAWYQNNDHWSSLFRQECWSGLPFPSPADLPDPGIEPYLLHCKQILYYLSHQGNPEKRNRKRNRKERIPSPTATVPPDLFLTASPIWVFKYLLPEYWYSISPKLFLFNFILLTLKNNSFLDDAYTYISNHHLSKFFTLTYKIWIHLNRILQE